MFVGSPVGAALCDPSFLIRGILISRVGNSIRYDIDVWAPLRNAYLAPFVGGKYAGKNIRIGADGLGVFETLAAANDNSIWFEDAGDFASFPAGTEPSDDAVAHQEFTAKSARLAWPADPVVSPPIGDTQLNSISITGAERGKNVTADDTTPTRGMISYSILTNGSNYEISAWQEFPAGPRRLIAWGSCAGGAITLDPVNDSGMSIAATLTYSADIQPGVAFLELAWNKTYELHFDTAALSFPRAVDVVVADKGSPQYEYLLTALPNGTIHYAILGRSDEGVLDATPAEAGTLTIRNAPAPPQNLRLSGTAAALTLDWDAGESGCSYLISSSDPECPVNYASWPSPAQIAVGTGILTTAIPALSGYAPVDNTTDFATLNFYFDAIAGGLISAFNTGQTGFSTEVEGVRSDIGSLIVSFCAAINADPTPFLAYLDDVCDTLQTAATIYAQGDASGWTLQADAAAGTNLITAIESTGSFQRGDIITIGTDPEQYVIVDLDLAASPPMLQIAPPTELDKTAGAALTLVTPDATLWTAGMTSPVEAALARLGILLISDPSVYQLPGIPAPVAPSIAVSLYALGAPYVPKGPRFRFGVQAIKGGVTEQSFQELEVRFNADGTIQLPAPNAAQFVAIGFNGLQIIVDASVLDDDSEDTAAYIDLYVVAAGSSIDYMTPTVSVALPAPITGYHHAQLTHTVGGIGAYDIAVKARSAAGERSRVPALATRYITTAAPPDIAGIAAAVSANL